MKPVDSSRRAFLRSGSMGLIASATMAEAGAFAEFLNWISRKPAFSIPSNPLIKAHHLLLPDSAFDLEALLAQLLGIRMGRTEAANRSLGNTWTDERFVRELTQISLPWDRVSADVMPLSLAL
jgi:hypothetical protein